MWFELSDGNRPADTLECVILVSQFQTLKCWYSMTHEISFTISYDDVIKWKHSSRYWPFVRRIHRSPMNSPHTGQWRVALTFSLICAWINDWVNNRETGDLRRHRIHYDVIVTTILFSLRYCCLILGTILTTLDDTLAVAILCFEYTLSLSIIKDTLPLMAICSYTGKG